MISRSRPDYSVEFKHEADGSISEKESKGIGFDPVSNSV